MACSDDLRGKYVTLKAVTPDDADFILSIRNDEQFTGKIPRLDCSLEEQRQWIMKQRANPDDYYYIIWSNDGKRLGTIGAYYNKNGEYETGRTVSYGDPRENIEAIILLSDFVFSFPNREYIALWCLAENKKVITQNKQFGMIVTQHTVNDKGEEILCGVIKREDYFRCSNKFKKLLGWYK